MRRVTAALILLLSLGVYLSRGEDLAHLLARNPVWILDGLKWEKDPGASNQSYAGGGVLIFDRDGGFGMFGGIILRQGGRLALGTGEGEIVHAGSWKIVKGEILIDYRLVRLEKVIRLEDEKPPAVPGPLLHAVIRPKQEPGSKGGRRIYIEIEQRRYVPTSNFDASGLEEQLRYLGEKQVP